MLALAAVTGRGAISYCGPILIVDSDDGFRADVKTSLARLGYPLAEAAMGDEALRIAFEERPSLVLIEIDVPGASGLEVCRELNERYGPDLPIIFVSATRTGRLDRIGGLLVGADDYMAKPVDLDELLARVRRHLSRAIGKSRAVDAATLTRREREILGMLAAGLDQRSIARELIISPKTVATHIQRILTKIGVGSRAQAVAYAHQHGIIEPARSLRLPRRAGVREPV
ncbi:MAG TPA: response regulator transcription factor [Gaiellaceae bacterium]|nr:response regulator transcription factor [Gaiellaceae bacterium]